MLYDVYLIKKCGCKTRYLGEWADIIELFFGSDLYVELEIIGAVNENR